MRLVIIQLCIWGAYIAYSHDGYRAMKSSNQNGFYWLPVGDFSHTFYRAVLGVLHGLKPFWQVKQLPCHTVLSNDDLVCQVRPGPPQNTSMLITVQLPWQRHQIHQRSF